MSHSSKQGLKQGSKQGPRSKFRIVLYAVAGLLGLLVVALLAAYFFVDINAHKARIEAAASSGLGMKASIKGKVHVGLFPGLHLTLEDMHIRNRGVEFVTAKIVDVDIALLPLIHNQIQIDSIVLRHARVVIERDTEGKYTYEQTEVAKGPAPPFNLPSFSVPDGTVAYTDKQNGEKFEATDCHLDASDLRHPGGKRIGYLKQLSITAKLSCGELHSDKLAASDIKFRLEGKQGVYNFSPFTLQVFGGKGSANVRVDRTPDVPHIDGTYSLEKFRIEEYFKTLSENKFAEGSMDFSAKLSMQGNTRDELRSTTNGRAELEGDKLTLYGTDLDKELERYKSSQKFNLVDVSAFFLAGPIGLSVTKGRDFGQLLRGTGGTTEVQTVVSKWNVENGVAHADDVAMATKENRLALKGGLNFVTKTYDDMVVAVVNLKGCPKVTQKIHGPFLRPEIDKPNFLQALAGPVLNLFKKAGKIFGDDNCEVFYSGSVQAPNQSAGKPE